MWKLAQIEIPSDEIVQVIQDLDFVEELIFVIIGLLFIVSLLIGYLMYRERSKSKENQLDSTNVNLQQQNFFDMFKTYVENQQEDRELFRKSIDANGQDRELFRKAIEEFSISNKMHQEGISNIKRWLELHDSSVAQSFERNREYLERRFLELINLIEGKENE